MHSYSDDLTIYSFTKNNIIAANYVSDQTEVMKTYDKCVIQIDLSKYTLFINWIYDIGLTKS